MGPLPIDDGMVGNGKGAACRRNDENKRARLAGESTNLDGTGDFRPASPLRLGPKENDLV